MNPRERHYAGSWRPSPRPVARPEVRIMQAARRPLRRLLVPQPMTDSQNPGPSTMDDWYALCAAEHAKEIAEGLHDDRCEYGRQSKRAILMLCHCSKRKRERQGFTKPPDDDLEFPPPDCPRCAGGLDHDGDSFRCYECCLSWASDGRGRSCSFTDDYGDITLDAEEAR